MDRGQVVVAGQPLNDLAAGLGHSPFYVYDRAALGARMSELRGWFPQVAIHYAMKANPMPDVVRFLGSLADGVDVASLGELRSALDAGVDPQHISFAGPGKGADELWAAVEAGVLINVESEQELNTVAAVAIEQQAPARVALRVNPDFELKSSGLRMGGGAKPFGVDFEVAPQVLARMAALRSHGLEFEGLHIFAGSQSLNAEHVAEALTASYELAVRLAPHAPAPLKVLNLGGGLGVAYFPGERHLDLAPISSAMAQIVERARTDFPGAEVVLELGRYLVAEAGLFVTRVVDRKQSRGQIFLVTDGGLNHFLAASGNFGQVVRKNYPVTTCAARVDATDSEPQVWQRELEQVTVVGPLCTPLDILADRMWLPKADVGDWVVVFQAGAYGLTASPQQFLSRLHCIEIFK
jgi:diaminopimelate decarboxylase